MVGIVIVAHGGLSEELVSTTRLIIDGELPAVTSVAISGLEEPHEIKQSIEQAIAQVDDGDGVVVFTDMFGGTPSNIALSFLSENEVEVISGVNLPMLVEMVYTREGKTLSEVAGQLADTGRKSIQTASQYLRGQD